MKKDNKLLDKMMKEIQQLDKIAVLKEDTYVIRSILKGKSKNEILNKLNNKHPYDKITINDLNKFLILYKDVLNHEKTNIEKGYVRRLLKSKEGLTNELAELALKAKYMTDKYDNDGDNSNAVAALRTTADIFMKFAKIEGLAVDQPEVNVNMQMDKVVSEVTSKDSDFKKSILNIVSDKNNEKIVEAEVVENKDE